jgi:hypothetical protein
MRSVVMLLIVLACANAFGGPRYFPTGAFGDDAEFIEHWYSGQLSALKELPLCCGSKDLGVIVRFTWLRSFHHPVAIRLFRSGDGRWLLTTKVASGAGGYKPGRLVTNVKRELKANEAREILSLVAPATDYWKLSATEVDEPNSDGSITVHTDGAQWIVEVLDGSEYHVVDRWSPESGVIHDLGIRFMALSGRDFGSVY